MSMAKFSRLSSNDPQDIAWRVQQMHVDTAIEAIDRNPILVALVAEMDAAGLSPEEKIKRVIAFDLNSVKNTKK
jgi:hypothetical protein